MAVIRKNCQKACVTVILLMVLCTSVVRGLLMKNVASQNEPPEASIISKGSRLAAVSQVLRVMLNVLNDDEGKEQFHPYQKVEASDFQEETVPIPISHICGRFNLDRKDCDRVVAYLDFRVAGLSSSMMWIHTQLQPFEKLETDHTLAMSLSTLLKHAPTTLEGSAQLYWSDLNEILDSSVDNSSAQLRSRGILFSFGDNGAAPCYPTIQKTREVPSSGNDVLLNLNSNRHWQEVAGVLDYDKPFKEKLDRIVWRGSSTGFCEHPYTGPGDVRMRLATKYYGSKDRRIDVGFHNIVQGCTAASWYRKFEMSLTEQLDNKFLLALQGNDKASSLNWMLASNSVVFMPPATIESWLLETRLVPWEHYVPLRQDLEDLVEQLDWAMENPEKAEAIAHAGRRYIEQFVQEDAEREFRVGAAVLTSYMQRIRVVDDAGAAGHRVPGAVVGGNSSSADTLSSCDCVPKDRDPNIRAGFCKPIDYQQRAHDAAMPHVHRQGRRRSSPTLQGPGSELRVSTMLKTVAGKMGQLAKVLMR